MVRTRAGVVARVLAIAVLLCINAAVGVRADSDCYICIVDGLCLPLTQGSGVTTCLEVGGISCYTDGSCSVNP